MRRLKGPTELYDLEKLFRTMDRTLHGAALLQ
jgi:hypothetical protein